MSKSNYWVPLISNVLLLRAHAVADILFLHVKTALPLGAGAYANVCKNGISFTGQISKCASE